MRDDSAHARNHDLSTAAEIFANGTYFPNTLRILDKHVSTHSSVVVCGKCSGTFVTAFSWQSTMPSEQRQGCGHCCSLTHSLFGLSTRPVDTTLHNVQEVSYKQTHTHTHTHTELQPSGSLVSTPPRQLYFRERPGDNYRVDRFVPRVGLDENDKSRTPGRPPCSVSLYRLSYRGREKKFS